MRSSCHGGRFVQAAHFVHGWASTYESKARGPSTLVLKKGGFRWLKTDSIVSSAGTTSLKLPTDMCHLLILILISGLAFAAPDEEAAVATVEKMFRAMSAHDGEMLRSTMLPGARLFSVRDADSPAASRSLDEFVKQIVGSKTELLERFTIRPLASVHGRIAQVWGDYEFLRDGKFSHCGIDTVTLFKTDEGWRIATLSYTVETTGCKGH